MSISLAIIIITCIVSFTSFNRPRAIDDLSMWPMMIDSKKQYYRFITSGFIHGDFMHLLFNMFTLYFFGPLVEQQLFPPLYFIGFYLLGLILSDLPSYFKHRRSYGYRSIGASGAISAIVFASVLLDPWAKIGIFGIIPIPAILYAVLYVVYCVYAGRRGGDNINHDAHLWGGLFGIVFSIVLYPSLLSYFLQQLMHPRF
jgi:membrane associated rhomboid family serine protease